MKTYGVILELNPFHSGHKYFLDKVKKIAQNNYIIAIIPLYNVQRGELGILDPQIKAKELLKIGVDLVIAAPFFLINQGGKYFALNLIEILNIFQVNEIICGSESNDLELIENQYKEMNNFKEKQFQEGYLKNSFDNLLSNDILVLSYYSAIQEVNPSIKIHLVKRIENNYNDKNLSKIASATSIRKLFNSNQKNEKLLDYLDPEIFTKLIKINQKKIYSLFKYQFYLLDKEDNKNIFLSEHGELINKLNKYIKNDKIETIEELASKSKDKNNSKYKIQRLCLNILLNVKNEEKNKYQKDFEEILVLGFSKRYSKNLKNQKIVYQLKKEGIYKYDLLLKKIIELVREEKDVFKDITKPIISERK